MAADEVLVGRFDGCLARLGYALVYRFGWIEYEAKVAGKVTTRLRA